MSALTPAEVDSLEQASHLLGGAMHLHLSGEIDKIISRLSSEPLLNVPESDSLNLAASVLERQGDVATAAILRSLRDRLG